MTSTHIQVRGVVQGVGFRPFVHGLAAQLHLRGWVRNTSAGVEIVVQGQAEDMQHFLRRLSAEAPTLARIDSLEVQPEAAACDHGAFVILPSAELPGACQPVPPDAAICPDCERELFDSADRRFLHPFVSCTNCGPRFTIVSDLPCDRRNTVMDAFPLCPACQAEYENPLDRRFHAQASSCPICGPCVVLQEKAAGSAKLSALQVVLRARRLLREGCILAIKGLGGFHLACDANHAAAVAELRRRKQRRDKPFALMAADTETVRAICHLGSAEAEALLGRARPVVLLERKRAAELAGIAPKLDRLGFMLPYTPLHHLLLNQIDPILAQEPAPAILVMTSGNRSNEPIAADNEEAQDRLLPLADALLLHDRAIHARCDDSVVLIDQEQHAPVFFRRSRGHAPQPLRLPFPVRPMLAMGGELKNVFCLAREEHAFLSQHHGDLEHAESCAFFEQSIRHFSRLFRIRPELVVHDLHPLYFTTRCAQQLGLPRLAIQHHHAHVAACMADNGLKDRRVIGLAFDGTGCGTDGAIWGGEVLIASYSRFERFAHLEYLPLPGGDAAIRHPWRIALGHAQALGLDLDGLPFLRTVDGTEAAIVRQQVDKQINAPPSSSMGRLFDAVASLVGICCDASYEAQAAIELEVLSKPFVALSAAWQTEFLGQGRPKNRPMVVRLKKLFEAVISDIRAEEPIGLIGARFHRTIARLAIELCLQARHATGLNEVALSGGVWQNQILLHLVRHGLAEAGFTVYVHKQTPANDGGLALGQAAAAQAMTDKGSESCASPFPAS